MAKREPFLYGRRQCIFCERQPPAVKISKEHVFGDWLRDLFPRDSATTHTLGLIDWKRGGLHQPTITRTQGQGHSGSKKVKVVCKECNETWLSNSIEDIAKPILTLLITGQPTTIDADMQRILASWAAKTVMTSEQVNKDKAVVQQHERTWLKDKLEPPPGWHIWIGSYSGMQWRDLAIFQHQGGLTVPSTDISGSTEHNLELTMIGAGQLLFLVINSTWQRIWDILEGLGTPGGVGLARIWPITDAAIRWPRPLVLTDAEAEYFTTYLARVLDQPV
jgi:hypothetical protein